MKTSRLLTWIAVLAFARMASAQDAASPSLRSLLQDALFAEEADKDLAKAAEAFERLLKSYDQQRAYAATALYHLAEIRRKESKNDQAMSYYQRLLREFPDQEQLAKLARENLVAIGGKEPEAVPRR